MQVKDLSQADLADRLKGEGLRIWMGPFVLLLRTGLPELVESIHLLYAHFQIASGDDFVDLDVGVDCPSWWSKHIKKRARFYQDGKPKFQTFKRDLVLPMLEWAINWSVFTRPHQYMILHSAVVEKHGHAVILPGEPGAGKSTLCAGLCLRGWRLLSDEVAVMRPPSTQLISVPRPIGLKEESINVIKTFEPTAVLGPSTPGTRKGTVAHVQPDADSVARGKEDAIPGLIVFPRYQPGIGIECRYNPKGKALLRIANDAFNFSIRGEVGFNTLADLVDTCDCYHLTYSQLDDAAATLDTLLLQRIERGQAELPPATHQLPTDLQPARMTG
jgi:HprK-related kinase A